MIPTVELDEGSLREALETVLEDELGRHIAVIAIARKVSEYSSSFRVEDVTVDLQGEGILQLVLKDFSWQTMLDGARLARDADLHDPEREIRIYRHLLPRLPSGPPKFVGACVDDAIGRHWLFLERVRGLQLRHVGELAAWEATARWTGRFHSAGACPSQLAAAVELELPVWDADRLRRPLEEAHRLRRNDATRRQLLAPIVACHEAVVDRLCALPSTVVHGELYPSNVIIEDSVPTSRLCVLDWETAAIGPGILDLAALTEGEWQPSDRQRLIRAYLIGRDGIITPASERSAALDLTCARLQMALEMALLPDDLVMPEDLAADWLARASSLAEELTW